VFRLHAPKLADEALLKRSLARADTRKERLWALLRVSASVDDVAALRRHAPSLTTLGLKELLGSRRSSSCGHGAW
jgi:hypothetical protein